MTVTSYAVDDPPLRFDRTIDRAMVHRASVAEVFVTDVRETDPLRLAVAAQLPLNHGFYGDHRHRPPMVDPMLLLECGRQAGICGSHALGVPRDRMMLVNAFRLLVHDVGALQMGHAPVDLRIDNEVEPTRFRGGRDARDVIRRVAAGESVAAEVLASLAGRLRQGISRQQLHIGGRHVASHEMEVSFVSPGEYAALRLSRRDTPAPLSSALDELGGRPGHRLPPYRVGRMQPVNVVLADLVRDPGGMSARVAPYLWNRTLFDHDYDHLPATVLAEAARQLALVVLGGDAGHVAVTGVDATFRRFAELDDPVTATTAQPAPGGRFTVAFQQAGADIAEIGVDTEVLR